MFQIKVELHSISAKSQKDGYILKCQSYQQLIAKYKKTLLTTSTSSLNGTRTASIIEREQQSLEVIKRARAQLAETVDCAVGVSEELVRQRGTMVHIQDGVTQTNALLGQGNRTLNRMNRWYRG